MGRKLSALAAWLLFWAVVAGAQTVSPVIVEYPEKARGKFAVTNDSVIPLNVVLEPRSFSVDSEGKAVFRPLDPGVTLRLSAMSFRIPPRQSYTVFYEARADRVPAWLCIYSVITGPQDAPGIKIALELPHTVYLLPKKAALDRSDVAVLRAELSADRARIEAEVENHGQQFDRVREIEVTSPAGGKRFAGFPLFPGQKRRIRLEWDPAGEPGSLILRFARFQVEHPVGRAQGSP